MVTRGNCTICFKAFDMDSDSLTVAEDLFDFLTFLVETIDTSALRNVLICAACQEKINEAVNFKISYLSANVETGQQKTDYNGKFYLCYICKNTTKSNSAVSLFNSCYENVLSYMVLKEDLDHLVDPQICDGCQTGAINFQSVTLFLSVYDLNKTSNDQLNSDSVTNENEVQINIVDNCVPENIKLNVSIAKLKQKIEEIEKSEETEPSSTGFWTLNNKDQERSLILSCPESLRADTYVSNYENLNDNIDEMTFKCGECEFQAKHTEDLYRHAIIHINLNEVDLFQPKNSKFRRKRKTDRKRPKLIHKNNQNKMFNCDICEFQTKYKDDLKKHGLVHKNINKVEIFKCLCCEYQTKHKARLKQHALLHKNSNEAELFKCPNCEYQTQYKSHLKRHSLTHKNMNEVKLFKCLKCEYETKCKYRLKQHDLIHKNIKEVEMFKCLDCKFRTKYRGALQNHRLIHKNSNEAELFKCLRCEYKTNCKGRLKQHDLIHKNINEVEIFKCLDCEFKTKYRGSLQNHALAHKSINDAKRFKCLTCEYQTKYPGHLKRHMLSHKGNR